MTKLVVESALEGEITDHLGFDKHDVSGWACGPATAARVRSSLPAKTPHLKVRLEYL
uniref:hypothetical protein n=1 Tax=Phytohabitans suffuscus TaxID=624315 RepID=UPI001E40D009|nr:hypothetical protein [Phytohabitans suffuscus]